MNLKGEDTGIPATSVKKPDILMPGRFAVLVPLSLIFLAAAFVTRLVLLVKSLHVVRPDAGLLLKIFGIGLFCDTVALLYAAALASIFLIVLPIYRSRGFCAPPAAVQYRFCCRLQQLCRVHLF